MRKVLFGNHSTQMPAIAQYLDHARYEASFAPLDAVDLARFDLVVPLKVAQIDAARAADAMHPRRAVLPTAELVALADDKLAFNRWLIDHGFGAHVPELLEDGAGVYPHIVKGAHGDFGAGIQLVRSAEEERPLPDGGFRQRAIAGHHEDVLHMVRIGGRIVFRLAYRYDMGVDLSVRGQADAPRGIAPVEAGDALAPCEAILAALGYEGTCCFNYKRADGGLFILEMNPRFGGSLVGEVTRYLDAHFDALG
jgi:predicted ATP-grasp superfamily ATP-dependent carboligase